MYRQQSEVLPQHLVLSIERILDLDDTDPLGIVGDSFNVVDVINAYFPDGASRAQGNDYQTLSYGVCLEESLGKLDTVQVQLAQDERDLRDEIAQLQEELKLQQDPIRIQLIQEMISVCYVSGISFYLCRHDPVHQELLGQMSLIREKASESEAIVRNITSDIQVLDLAKKNIILSMTTLKRLQMLGMIPHFVAWEIAGDRIYDRNSQCTISARGLRQGQEIPGHHTKSLCTH
jgi:vacuolar protein sorting-associated protein 53